MGWSDIKRGGTLDPPRLSGRRDIRREGVYGEVVGVEKKGIHEGALA